jgi:uncharacterized protein (TIGR02996 family)
MDDLDQREAFLKAIFDAPDDDLPRLVFADWLDERGEYDWAELIRVQCELARADKIDPARLSDLVGTEYDLFRRVYPNASYFRTDYMGGNAPRRGFLQCVDIKVTAEALSDPAGFRCHALRHHPEWYESNSLQVSSGLIASSKPIGTILTSPVTQKVTQLDLSGGVEHHDSGEPYSESDPRTGEFNLLAEFSYRPTVTLQAVEALVNARECRRITHLDLRNNDLDNDAARAVLRSTNLIRLKSLHLHEGNQLRGRTWQQLLDKFGEDVVQ